MTSTRPKLRALREEHGWTQQELADQVARMAWLRRRKRVGVNADMVSKWERGQKRPDPLYREMLGLVFDMEAHDLGLGGPAPVDAGARGEVDGNSLIEMLGGAASLLDQLGAAGSILQPRMFDVWKDELMQRRALLKLMGLATTAGVVPALDRELTRSAKVTPNDVQDLDHLADRYQALYHSTAPAVLMTPVVAHLETLRDFLRQGASVTAPAVVREPGSGGDTGWAAGVLRPERLAGGTRVLQPRAGVGKGGGRSPAGRRGARARGVHPGERVLLQRGLDYLRAATSQVNKRPDGRVASWLSAVESEIRTNAGTLAEARVAVDRAREKLANPGLIADLPWFDYYDSTRLSGFAGYALLRDGQFESSKSSLTDAAGHLPRAAVKQKAVFLADITTVELAGGDLDQGLRERGRGGRFAAPGWVCRGPG